VPVNDCNLRRQGPGRAAAEHCCGGVLVAVLDVELVELHRLGVDVTTDVGDITPTLE